MVLDSNSSLTLSITPQLKTYLEDLAEKYPGVKPQQIVLFFVAIGCLNEGFYKEVQATEGWMARTSSPYQVYLDAFDRREQDGSYKSELLKILGVEKLEPWQEQLFTSHLMDMKKGLQKQLAK